jgi:hypothetical protein
MANYRYKRRRDGSRYRVYSGATKKRTSYSRKGSRGYRRDWDGDTIMGYGDYYKRGRKIGMGNGPPRIRNTKGGCIISHREYLLDVPSSNAFSTLVMPLNPGMPNTMPWLSRTAQNFEEWLPRGICVEFKSMSSDNPNTALPALGTVVIATQYNSSNPDFVNKSQMENYEFATSCKPSRSMLHCVETARSQTVQDEYYTRTGPLGANQDIKFYDLGKTQVSVVGAPLAADGSIIGELWITYEIELRKPKIPTDPLVEVAHFILPSAGVNGEAPLTPFGTTVTTFLPTSGSTMAAQLVGGAANGTIRFGPNARGRYMVTMVMLWTTGGTTGTWTIGNLNGCNLLNGWRNNTQSIGGELDSGTSTAITTNVSFIVNITGENASCTVSNNSTAVGGFNNAADVYIIELPDTLN